MESKVIEILKFDLNIGELHNLHDFEHINPVFVCKDESGETFTASMRLHINEELDGLVIADPRKFADDGYSINSLGSKAIARKENFLNKLPQNIILDEGLLKGVQLYKIELESLKKALLDGYDFDSELKNYLNETNHKNEIAFTCHDPNIIGGGNVILFRLINWLSQLGIKVTVYSCGTPPSWMRVNAKFKCFKKYKEMFADIKEKIIVVYSMWHIEAALKSNTKGKLIYHIRQIYEPFHYGKDYNSMIARKPAIELLECLKIGLITISPHLEDYYKRFHNLDSLLITNGIDPKVFYPSKKEKKKDNEITIVSVGHPNHFVKGAQVLIKAMRLVATRKKNIHFKWEILTGGTGNTEYDDVPANLKIIQDVGLSQLQMREKYSDADIFVNPSLYEGFGLPPIEAMMCGTPVVQADNSGLDFIIEDGKDCLVVPVNDEEKTAEAIIKFIDDKRLAKSIAEGGYQKAMQITVQHQFNMFVPVFEKILNIKFDKKKIESIISSFGYKINASVSLEEEIKKTHRFNPLISIIIPSYNQAEYLKEALDSIIAQTYTNWEAVVINDGSKDLTEEVMKAYADKDSRIRVFTKPNGGITSALNAGLEKAEGDFFCWLSSDDLFYPKKLELQVKAFEKLDSSYALVYGSFDILQESSVSKELQRQPYARPLIEGCEFPEALKFDFIDGCTIMIRMDVMREVSGFNPGIVHSQDMELWVRLASRGYRFLLLPDKLTIRRVHTAQSSTLNMIHCRYDAAWMMNFYLKNYHLLEMYRYINFSSDKGIKNFVEHFVSRTFDTEANINHPLLQEKFWNWFKEGIKALPSNIQNVILRNCLIYFMKHLGTTYKVKYYVEQCIEELKKERVFAPIFYDYSPVGRDFRETDRSKDEFASELFEYGLDLLVNIHTPLFAQELYFHNTNKLVDTPYKLAHSAFRYLSQFNNPYRDIVKQFGDFANIPNNKTEALELFCKLRFPGQAEVLLTYIENKDTDISSELDDKIAGFDENFFLKLGQICAKNPSIPILYYWQALGYEKNNKLNEAMIAGWNIIGFTREEVSAKMFIKLCDWAVKLKDFEKAWISINIAGALDSKNESIRQIKEKCTELFIKNNRTTPKEIFKHNDKTAKVKYSSEILSCKVQPGLNGKFVLDIECENGKKEKFIGKGALPYEKDLRPIIVTNNESHEKLQILPEQLYKYYSHGYDFVEAFERQVRNKFLENKICSISFYSPYTKVINGGTLVFLRMANWLHELGIQVNICSTDVKPDWFDLKCDFICEKEKSKLFSSIESDIVVAYSVLDIPEILKHVSKATRVYHIAQVIEDFHYHGYDYESCISPKGIFQLLHSLPVGRISVSGHITKYLKNVYDQSALQIENGIDLLQYSRKKKVFHGDEIIFCTVGSVRRLLKGVDDVVNALEIVAKKNPKRKISLVIASNDRPDIQQQLNLGNHNFKVVTLNNLSQDEMAQLYLRSDVYINGSWYEGFGLPSIEAMACGIPVIQSDNMGLDDIAKDKYNCMLCKPADPVSMAEKIQQLIETPELYNILVEGGIATAQKLSLKNSFNEFISVFERILVHKFDPFETKMISDKLEYGDLNYKITSAKNILNPVISLLIPFSDDDNDISDTIDSLLSQNYPYWEAIAIFNDSEISRNNYLALNNYSKIESRIKIVRSRNNNYASMLNAALKYCSGEWITVSQPGTIYSGERFTNLINAIEFNIDKKIIYSEYYPKDKIKDAGYSFEPDFKWLNSLPNKDYQVLGLFNKNFLIPAATAIHRSLFNEVPGFDPDLGESAFYYFMLNAHKDYYSLFSFNGTCFTNEDKYRYSEKNEKYYKTAICNFIENNRFEKILPRLKLEGREEVWRSIMAVIYVMNNKESLVNKSGCRDILAGRLLKWASENYNEEFSEKIKNVIASPHYNHSAIPKGLFHEYKMNLAKNKNDNKEQKNAADNSMNAYKDKTANNLVSIVLVTYGQIKYTLECIESVRKYTEINFELIVIDNASPDDTVSHFFEDESILLIQNKTNVGFPAAANQGIKAAKGSYILLLNNDTVLTRGWLESLVKVIESDQRIGIAGPISNEVSGLQKDTNAKYNSMEEMHKYAQKVKEKNKGEIMNFPRVAFLCTLIKREVIEKIGGLDERFSPGNFEDDDFCLRAQLAGYKTVIAKDIFIHHYGSKSFKANGTSGYSERLRINKEIFVNKWGGTPEEIWLQNKTIKPRQYKFPVVNNLFYQYYERAKVNLADKEYDLALENITKSIEAYPESHLSSEEIKLSEAMNIAGNIALALNELETAQHYFENELEQEPSSGSACVGLGNVFLLNNQYKEAKTMYEWGLKNNVNNKSAAEGLKKVNELLGLPESDNSLLLEEYKQKSVREILNEAYQFFEKQDMQGAIEYLESVEIMAKEEMLANNSAEDTAAFYNMKGFIYLGLKDFESARPNFERALSINGTSSQACVGLGEIFYLNEQLEAAKTMFEWGIRNNPENKNATDALAAVNLALGLEVNHSALVGE